MNLIEFNNFKTLNKNEFLALCKIIGTEKLKNIVLDYKKNDKSKGYHFGKSSKEWNNIDSTKPPEGFILDFMNVKFYEPKEEVEPYLLKSFQDKLTSKILGRGKNFNEISNEDLQEVLKGKMETKPEYIVLMKFFGYEYEQDKIDNLFQKSNEKAKKKAIAVPTLKVEREEIVEDSQDETIPEPREEELVAITESTMKKSTEKTEKGKSASEYESEIKKLNHTIESLNGKLELANESLSEQKSKVKETQKVLNQLKKKIENVLSIPNGRKRKEETKEYTKDDFEALLNKAMEKAGIAEYEDAKELVIRSYILLSLLEDEA
jgi:exonuclease VII small subunit